MPLVAIEAARSGLVTMAGFGVDGGDDAVFRDAACDAKDRIVALLEILSEDGREQLRSLANAKVERAPMQNGKRSVAIECPRASTSASRAFASSPIARGLAGLFVVVVPLEATAYLVFEVVTHERKQSHERRADEGDRVLGSPPRRRARSSPQNALATDEPRLASRTDHRLEDAIRLLRPTKPLAHFHEHGVHEPGEIEVERACGVLPPSVECKGASTASRSLMPEYR